jgi:hypothetical protein
VGEKAARPSAAAVVGEGRAELQARAQLASLGEQLQKNTALQRNRALLERLPDGGAKVRPPPGVASREREREREGARVRLGGLIRCLVVARGCW